MSNNPIFVGYEWQQAFDFPAGYFQLGDYVRAEFRSSPSDAELLASVTQGAGSVVEDDRLYITLSPTQTSEMLPGRVVTSLVVVKGSEEIPIGQIITIPVVVLPTRAS